MLSPIITTKGNWKRSYHFVICSPTLYCRSSPVPLSPMTAKCSEFGLLGSETCACCGCAPARQTMTASAPATRNTARLRRLRRTGIGRSLSSRLSRRASLLEGAFHVVGDEVRVGIEQDHGVAHEAVFELLGELRQLIEHLRRHRRDRDVVGVAGVGRELDRSLVFVVEDLRPDLRAFLAAKDRRE